MSKSYELNDDEMLLYVDMMDTVLDTLIIFADKLNVDRASMIYKFGKELEIISNYDDDI